MGHHACRHHGCRASRARPHELPVCSTDTKSSEGSVPRRCRSGVARDPPPKGRRVPPPDRLVPVHLLRCHVPTAPATIHRCPFHTPPAARTRAQLSSSRGVLETRCGLCVSAFPSGRALVAWTVVVSNIIKPLLRSAGLGVTLHRAEQSGVNDSTRQGARSSGSARGTGDRAGPALAEWRESPAAATGQMRHRSAKQHQLLLLPSARLMRCLHQSGSGDVQKKPRRCGRRQGVSALRRKHQRRRNHRTSTN